MDEGAAAVVGSGVRGPQGIARPPVRTYNFPMPVGIDIGGTFTDLVLLVEIGRAHV